MEKQVSRELPIVCRLCNQPMALGPESIADEDGGMVHEECYASKMKQKLAPRSARPTPLAGLTDTGSGRSQG